MQETILLNYFVGSVRFPCRECVYIHTHTHTDADLICFDREIQLHIIGRLSGSDRSTLSYQRLNF